jgi:hypothetical protein
MIIEERNTLQGHRTQVYEHMTNGGVDSIFVTCFTCNKTQEFDKAHYAKYRLALADARKWAESHHEEALDSPSAV